MGAAIKLIFLIAAITVAILTITLSFSDEKSTNNNIASSAASKDFVEEMKVVMPFKRASRFLAEDKNPRASDHCKKDNDICLLEGTNVSNSTCCNNKCMDLSTDKDNCGACKNKCVYTDTCCRGECVNISYDKRHCGKCNNRCMPAGYCIYGLCDYA